MSIRPLVLVYFGQAMNVSKPRHSDRGQNEATVWDATLATEWDTRIPMSSAGSRGGAQGAAAPEAASKCIVFFNFSNKFGSFVTRRA